MLFVAWQVAGRFSSLYCIGNPRDTAAVCFAAAGPSQLRQVLSPGGHAFIVTVPENQPQGEEPGTPQLSRHAIRCNLVAGCVPAEAAAA
jgi:hypothetical protein